MKRYTNIDRSTWNALLQRPKIDNETLNGTVQTIIDEVKKFGDEAISKFTKNFDGVTMNNFEVTVQEINEAVDAISPELIAAIDMAYKNISTFHQSQILNEEIVETMPGIKCWRKAVAIDKIGLYIPGGSAPLFSTILMLGIPAQIAGCKEIILCTPPNKDQKIDPTILYTAKLVGINRVFKVGGAQAIAAMAMGTKSIPQAHKIFGPGNQFVTKAKELVQQYGIAIDMPAGPSELLVIADKSCEPGFVAADLLSQAEHGPDSQVILLSDDQDILNQCLIELKVQLKQLPRKKIAEQALSNSKALVMDSLDECMDFSNSYAPEHLIIASNKAGQLVDQITNAGSVFIGNYSCESAGDYASGTNHTLPTNGYAKSYSGVSVDSFVKKITFQELDKTGLQNIGPAIEVMAENEGLIAHKNAVSIRLQKILK